MTVFSRTIHGGVVLLAALTLGLAGCSAAAGPAPTAPAAASAAASAAAAPAAADATGGAATTALDFTGPTLDGTTLDAATLAGTPVALWFWAPWCTICRTEAPDVAAVAAEFEGRVRVLGVPGRGEVEAMQGFVADTGTGGITHVVDADGSLWNRFGVVAQPALVVVDADGTTRSFAGALGAEQLREILAESA